jgi:large repetitive protein
LEVGAKAADLLVTVVTATDAQGTFTNAASVTSPTPDPTPGNNNSTDALPVTQLADLAITKTHTGEAHIGDDLTFTLQVTNAGPSAAQDVVGTDTLPNGMSFVSAGSTAVLPAAPRWVCTIATDTATCTLEDASGTPVALNSGGVAPPLPVVVTVGTAAYSSVDNTATVATSTREKRLTDNTAMDTVEVPPVVDLSVTKSHTGAFVVGQQALWLVTVSNAGPTPDSGPITVTDQLPPGITFVSAAGNGWTCAASGATVTCTSPAGLGVRQSSQIQLTVAVGAAAYPSVVNTVGVSSPAEDIDPSNNTATDPADIVPISMLSIVKQRIAQDGDQDTFAIRVTNKGPNATTAPITMVDQLPAGMNLVSATGTGWTCMTVQSTIT